MKYIFYLFIPCLVACQSFKNKMPIAQGLKGTVLLASGNQMPAPNRKQNPLKGIGATLYIYVPTIMAQTEGSSPVFSKINSKLITIVKTNSVGNYAVYLPAGKYSVFVKDDQGYFANESDGSGIINPVEVTKGNVTQRDWKLARTAVY